MDHIKIFLKVFFTVTCVFGKSNALLDLSGCETTKVCIFRPDGCSQNDGESCLISTYSYDSNQNNFEIEIRGGAGDGSNYGAFGFTEATTMESSDVYYCTGNDLRSAFIGDQFSDPVIDDALPNGVVSISAQTENGVAECTFTRPASVSKGGLTFDLTTDNFRLIQAIGTIEQSGQLVRHSVANRHISGPHGFLVSSSVPDTSVSTTSAASQGTVGESDGFGCGETRGCFQDPEGCFPDTTSGCRFVSYAYDAVAQTFDIEFTASGSAQYLAIAFGTQPDMVDADMYYCTQNQFFSGVITTSQVAPPPATEITGNSNADGLQNITSTVTNGLLQCSFKRPASVTKNALNGATDFNLSTTQYYLLYAIGDLAGSGALRYHSGRVRSMEQIDFTEVGTVSGSASMLKAHASLMLIAWMTCASIGVIIARHFKPLWHKKTLGGTKVWFQFHRGLMIFVLLCTVCAFIIVFVARGGYSSNVGAHPILGIIVTALTIINPTMALFRPHPGTPKRPIFNWAHWFVGTSARILAIVTIFLGVDLAALNLPEWDTYVLAAFVAVHILTEIVLEIVSAVYGHIDVYKKEKKDNKFDDYDNYDMGGDAQPPSDPAPRGAFLKYAILGVYACVNIGFLITFIAFVVMV